MSHGNGLTTETTPHRVEVSPSVVVVVVVVVLPPPKRRDKLIRKEYLFPFSVCVCPYSPGSVVAVNNNRETCRTWRERERYCTPFSLGYERVQWDKCCTQN